MCNYCNYTQKKKGTETVPLGYYCYKQYPFFRGALFFSLIIMYPCADGAPKQYPQGYQITDSLIVPLGALFWYPFFLSVQKGLIRLPCAKRTAKHSFLSRNQNHIPRPYFIGKAFWLSLFFLSVLKLSLSWYIESLGQAQLMLLLTSETFILKGFHKVLPVSQLRHEFSALVCANSLQQTALC